MSHSWKDLMLKFMRCIGENGGDWYPELWETYGISKRQAKKMVDAYEKKFPQINEKINRKQV